MAKVDWITWKTSPKEIINPSVVNEKIFDYFQNYNTYMNPVVYEQLKHEANVGGLSKNALIIDGNSYANEIAEDILCKIDEIKEIMNTLSEKINNSIEEQKVFEKQQLVESIENKIVSEKEKLNNIISNVEIQNSLIASGENPSDVAYIINDHINKLSERLEQAKAL